MHPAPKEQFAKKALAAKLSGTTDRCWMQLWREPMGRQRGASLFEANLSGKRDREKAEEILAFLCPFFAR
ncbi:hypothetical protein ATL39_2930 [Sinobaca qinghaiensis]|uniref:Uncharacterized protein n=1 Tax=Sinobaca qinghaiensis TaxID=342944 RepID=A0A419UWK6_9BACL|nr:hypothetical protein ATL39_2930 [Sinobaca qinghaiensis]